MSTAALPAIDEQNEIDAAIERWCAIVVALSARWLTDEMSKIAAVDAAWQAAVDGGLVEIEGVEEIQRALALAFDPAAWDDLPAAEPEAPPIEPSAGARPTPQVTIDGVLFAVRERGLEALGEPNTLERLSRCDEAARAQINARLAALFPEAAA